MSTLRPRAAAWSPPHPRAAVARVVRLALAGWLVLSTFASLVSPATVEAHHTNIKFPFAAGPAWVIAQGYNTSPVDGGSHYNCDTVTLKDQISQTRSCSAYYQYKYSLDLRRADGNTAGAPVLSPVNGTIRWIDEAYGGMSINLNDGYAFAFFHVLLAPGLAAGQTVTQGQHLGTVAPAGQAGNGGTPHIHVTLWQTTDGGNWSRHSVPFTDAHKIDGYDFPARADSVKNQHQGTQVFSSNVDVQASSTAPGVPTLVSPATGTTYRTSPVTVTLTWNAVTGATEYQVVINDGAMTSPWVSGTSWTTPSLGNGQYAWQVRARNSSGMGNLSPKWVFWVDPPPSPTPTPTPVGTATPGPLALSLDNASGRVGATINATGTGFGANETVRLYFDSTSSPVLVSATTNSVGGWSASFTVPNATGGNHSVIARGATSGKQASATFRVTPYLLRTPYQGPPGTTINLTVQGFGANETVRVTWQTTSGPLLANVATNAQGTGSTTFPMPEGSTGWHDYVGVGQTSGLTAWGALYVERLFTVSPTSGAPGTTINATVKGFPASQGITVAWNKTAGSAGTTVCSGTTDAKGNYGCAFAIPQSPAGTFPVVATAANGASSSQTVGVSGPAAVSVSPTSGHVGTDLTINIGGFGANETINLSWNSSSAVWQSTQTDAAGAALLRATVPNLAAGSHTLRARGTTSGKSASTTLNVLAGAGSTSMIGPGTYSITATEEGLVGQTTSSGHTIQPYDHFVALPACTQSSCPWLTPGGARYVAACGDNCYVRVTNPATGKCSVAPVLDLGPWFTNDNWWDPAHLRNLNNLSTTKNILAQGYTGADAARNGIDVGYGLSARGIGISDKGYEVGNRAAMDIADGTWVDIGFRLGDGIGRVTVTLLWQSGEDPVAAARACGQSGPRTRPGGAPTSTPVASPTATATRTPTPTPTSTPAQGSSPTSDRTLSLSPERGPVGTRVTVKGIGFRAGETVDIYLVSMKTPPVTAVVADATGSFTVSIVVPDSPAGYLRFAARGRASGHKAGRSFLVTPSLSRSPSQGPAGTRINVTARGFGAAETVELRWDTATGPVLTRLTTGANGTGSGSFTIPKGSAIGWHDYTGLGLTSGVRAWGAVRVTESPKATISLSPTSGRVMSRITMSGEGFGAGETVDVFWNSSTRSSASATTDPSGAVSLSVVVPLLPAGSHTVALKGRTSGKSGTATFTVVPSVSLSPSSGPSRTEVKVIGRGWDAGANVNVYWNRTATSTGSRVCSATTSSSGSFSCTFTVPDRPEGRYPVVGVSGSRSATAHYRITEASGFGVASIEGNDSSIRDRSMAPSPTATPTATPEPEPTATPTASPDETETPTVEESESPTAVPEAPAEEAADDPPAPPEPPPATDEQEPAEMTLGDGSQEGTEPAPTQDPAGATEPVGHEGEPAPGEGSEPTEPASPAEEPPLPDESHVPEDAPATEAAPVPPEATSPTRAIVLYAVADTSVSAAAPELPQLPEWVGTLAAGGPEGSVTFVTFLVEGVAAGAVVEARLVLTPVGEFGTAGGMVGALPEVWIDEAGLTYVTAPVYDVPPALAGDGTIAVIPWAEPWVEIAIDVTGTVQADGTITFVLHGTPDAPLLLASRETGSPPRLVITVRDAAPEG